MKAVLPVCLFSLPCIAAGGRKCRIRRRGRAAEYWGPAHLDLDRWVRLNGVPELAKVWHEAQDPQFRKYLDAFAQGMDDYAKAHPDAKKLHPVWRDRKDIEANLEKREAF